MALTVFTETGEVTSNFLLNDVDFYVLNADALTATSGDWVKLGFSSAEKSINPINEYYTREDKIPRVPTYTKLIKKGLEVKFDLSNQSAELDSVLSQGTLTTPLSGVVEVDFGTDSPNVEYRAVRFSAELDSGTTWTLTIPKAKIAQSGEKKYGGQTETVTPLIVSAVYNPSVDATKNLYYVQYLAPGISPLADIPPAFT